eukprot:760613-Hanusia_phi.AAC.3
MVRSDGSRCVVPRGQHQRPQVRVGADQRLQVHERACCLPYRTVKLRGVQACEAGQVLRQQGCGSSRCSSQPVPLQVERLKARTGPHLVSEEKEVPRQQAVAGQAQPRQGAPTCCDQVAEVSERGSVEDLVLGNTRHVQHDAPAPAVPHRPRDCRHRHGVLDDQAGLLAPLLVGMAGALGSSLCSSPACSRSAKNPGQHRSLQLLPSARQDPNLHDSAGGQESEESPTDARVEEDAMRSEEIDVDQEHGVEEERAVEEATQASVRHHAKVMELEGGRREGRRREGAPQLHARHQGKERVGLRESFLPVD